MHVLRAKLFSELTSCRQNGEEEVQNPSFSLQSCFSQSICPCHVKSQHEPVSRLDVLALYLMLSSAVNASTSLLPLALKERSNIEAGYDSDGLPCRYFLEFWNIFCEII